MPADSHPDAPLDSEAAARLCEEAEQMYLQGDFDTSCELYKKALDALLALEGPDSRHIATAQRGLGVAMLELGDFRAAQTLLEQAVETRTRILAPNHPDTAQALSGLSTALFCLNDVEGALQLAEQALAIRERALGGDHPDTIESLNNIGVIINRQGNRQRAIELHTEALRRCERALGDHRSTVETLNALAVKLAHEQSTYARARALYERALAMSERVLGATHPLTARLMNNLAAVLSDLDLHSEARALLERSLLLHEQIYGPEHPNTAWVLVNIGDIEFNSSDYDAARKHFSRALIIREAALGAFDSETVRTLQKLVAVLGTLGQGGDQAAMLVAMPLHTCLTALESAAGTFAPGQQHMPGAHLDPDRAAQQLHELVAKLEVELHRPEPSAEALTLLEQAAELEQQARKHVEASEYTKAQALLERSLAVREQAQGALHMDLVPPLQLLEVVLQKSGRASAVLPIRQRIADIQIAALGETHPQTQLTLADLAGLLEYEYGLGGGDAIWDRLQQAQEAYLGQEDVFARMSRDALKRLRALRPQDEPLAADDAPRRSRSEKREAELARPNPLAEELLDGLDSVNWHTLQHAYGPADDVPNLLRMLLSDDPDVCEDAFEQLFGNIWHQGTVYEASAHAVPFLLRMLADERTPDRLGILVLLSSLAAGNSYLAVHHRAGDDVSDLRKLLAEKGEDFDTSLRAELGWVHATHEAVAQGVDLFLDLLEDREQDTDLRLQALETIAVLSDRKDTSLPRLRSLLATTEDLHLRTGLTRALHDLMDDSSASQQAFAELLHVDEPEAVQLIAAVASLTRARQRAPGQAVAVILDLLRELGAHRHHIEAPAQERETWQSLEQRFYPAWGEGPLAFSLEGLKAMGGDAARTAILQALQLLHDSEDAEVAARQLLALVFDDDRWDSIGIAYSIREKTGRRKLEYYGVPKPPSLQAHELTAAQREVLTVLVDHDPLWEHESDLLGLFGLPTERQEIRKLLAAGGKRG